MNLPDLRSKDDRLVGRVLQRQAEQIPEATFIHAEDDKYSYRKANSIVNSYAAGFINLGVRKGDIVSIFMKPCPEVIFITLALNKIGAIWSPINTDYKKDWLLMTIQDSCAKILVTDEGLLPKVVELGDQLSINKLILKGPEIQLINNIETVLLSEFESLPDDEPIVADLHYGDTSAILWTSGTTGKPKGVMQSHNCWITVGEYNKGNVFPDAREGDIFYLCLPLYNTAPWVQIFAVLVSGLTIALDESYSVGQFWNRCRRYNATYTKTIGAMHMFLWNSPEKADDADNPIRKAIMIPMPENIIEPFKKRFGIDSIIQGYGNSEMMAPFSRDDNKGKKWKPNCIGAVNPSFELKLLDENDEEVQPGVPGEFCVRPRKPFVMFNGYFNNPKATTESYRNLWFHSGDLGIRDQDGDYFFYDRKKDYIRYKGRNLSSFQIEAIVNKHPDVAQAAAIGVESETLSSEAELKISVVRKTEANLTAEDLARYINDNAPYFYVPRYIEFLEDLPKTPTQKVQKYLLRKRGVTETTWDRDATGFKVTR